MSAMSDALASGDLDAVREAKIEVDVEEAQRKQEVKRRLNQSTRAPIVLLSEADFHLRPPTAFLVQGLILEKSIGSFVGSPGSLKTFTATDLALSIASHQPTWLGRTLTKSGPVVYVLGEGGGRFSYRVKVWKQERQITDDLPFFIVPHPLNLRDPELMAEFLTMIVDHHPVITVFDTLNTCTPGMKENMAEEMSEAVAAMRLLTESTGGTVIHLHHPRKDEASARGSGANLGAIDFELWMKKTSDKSLFTLSVGKSREADDELEINLKKKVVELAGKFEDDGTPVTSCVVELADAAYIAKSLATLERKILELVRNNPNIPRREVTPRLGLRQKTVENAIDTLLLDQQVEEIKGGRGNRQVLLRIKQIVVNP